MSISALRSEFPLLLPSLHSQSEPPQSLHGFITISDCDHQIYLEMPKFPSAKGMTLRTDVALSSVVERCRTELDKIDRDCTIVEYLRKFQQICSSADANLVSSREIPLPEDTLFKSLLMHLETIGWSRVSEVSSDFTCISLQTSDDRDRPHTLKVLIQPGYPDEEPVVEANLPKKFKFSWNSIEGLSSVVSAWEEHIASLQHFWDVLDELDETAVILDPPSPERRHNMRRILLKNHVSVQLTISTDHPSGLPQILLLGASSAVDPLNRHLTEKFQDWESERSIVSNLEYIFGVGVVRRSEEPEGGTDGWGAECAVCYCLHLEDNLPDLTCDHCSQSFHIHCLYEWLHGLPNSRQSKNFIAGECPYCTQRISCKVPA